MIELYFKISDSEMFGGIGSVGYASCLTGIENLTDEQVRNQIKAWADTLDVPIESVQLISKEEYDENMNPVDD